MRKNVKVSDKKDYIQDISELLSGIMGINEDLIEEKSRSITNCMFKLIIDLQSNIYDLESRSQEYEDDRHDEILKEINEIKEKSLTTKYFNDEVTKLPDENSIKMLLEQQKSEILDSAEAYQKHILEGIHLDYENKVKDLVNLVEKLKYLLEIKNGQITSVANRYSSILEEENRYKLSNSDDYKESIKNIILESDKLGTERVQNNILKVFDEVYTENINTKAELNLLKTNINEIYSYEKLNQINKNLEKDKIIRDLEIKLDNLTKENINYNRKYYNLLEKYMNLSDKSNIQEEKLNFKLLEKITNENLVDIFEELEGALDVSNIDRNLEINEEEIYKELEKVDKENYIKPTNPHQKGKDEHILRINEDKPEENDNLVENTDIDVNEDENTDVDVEKNLDLEKTLLYERLEELKLKKELLEELKNKE